MRKRILETWPIHEAKARFSELVKRAQQSPQQLTSHGQPVAVVLSAEAFQRQQHAGESLLEFLQRSPLADADDLVFERDRSSTRDVEI
jgi:prevent-host-death family protein